MNQTQNHLPDDGLYHVVRDPDGALRATAFVYDGDVVVSSHPTRRGAVEAVWVVTA